MEENTRSRFALTATLAFTTMFSAFGANAQTMPVETQVDHVSSVVAAYNKGAVNGIKESGKAISETTQAEVQRVSDIFLRGIKDPEFMRKIIDANMEGYKAGLEGRISESDIIASVKNLQDLPDRIASIHSNLRSQIAGFVGPEVADILADNALGLAIGGYKSEAQDRITSVHGDYARFIMDNAIEEIKSSFKGDMAYLTKILTVDLGQESKLQAITLAEPERQAITPEIKRQAVDVTMERQAVDVTMERQAITPEIKRQAVEINLKRTPVVLTKISIPTGAEPVNHDNTADDISHVTTNNGRYTVIFPENGEPHALRDGEPWKSLAGQDHILALAEDLKAAKEEIISLGDKAEGYDRSEAVSVEHENGDLMRLPLSNGMTITQDARFELYIETPEGQKGKITGDNLALSLVYDLEEIQLQIAKLQPDRPAGPDF